jgi:hypothetical protein
VEVTKVRVQFVKLFPCEGDSTLAVVNFAEEIEWSLQYYCTVSS